MDEIEDATGRISTLVAAVKQYSYMDAVVAPGRRPPPGLDSTVVMLGHKLGGIEVVREYDRTLPRVPAYAAELNQVWTNLIDNAADAMGGRRHPAAAHHPRRHRRRRRDQRHRHRQPASSESTNAASGVMWPPAVIRNASHRSWSGPRSSAAA